ncbi:MAG: chorismate synthase [Candidatus Sericytochromatia bacterium]|nr:chorismate synthase [Candidatus Sericytochromatia bacterium]
MPLRLLTAGESHGPWQVALLEGVPAGVPFDAERLRTHMRRRQSGHGRSARQRIEQDMPEVHGGIRLGKTTGAPVALAIPNLDHARWTAVMTPEAPSTSAAQDAVDTRRIEHLRPGHADYAGAVKYGLDDVRDVLERASARETVARVAAAGILLPLLEAAGIRLTSHVLAIGTVTAHIPAGPDDPDLVRLLQERAEPSPVRCADSAASAAMVAAIDAAGKAGDSLGGIFEVVVTGLPVGLGSHVQWDRRLDGRLAQAVMSIQAVKGVAIGDAFGEASRLGSAVHDPFADGFVRTGNRAGGLEGGMTNGQPLIVRGAMKPISTLRQPLQGARWPDGAPAPAHFERADICAVPAAGVVAEAMVAFVIADALLEKTGGDSLAEVLAHLEATRKLADRSEPTP